MQAKTFPAGEIEDEHFFPPGEAGGGWGDYFLPLEPSLFRALESNAFCAGLKQADLEWLAGQVDVVEVPQGGILFEDRDQPDAVYLVAEGQVSFLSRISLSADFTEVAQVLPGDFFGEGSLLDRLAEQVTGQAAQSPAREARARNARARVQCPETTRLLALKAGVFGALLARQPVVMARNLLRHSAAKSRMSSQTMFDEVIKRESKVVVEGLSEWVARHTVNFLTTLQLNADVLKQRAMGGPFQVFVMEMVEALANFRETIQCLRELAAGVPAAPPLSPVSLRAWMNGLEQPVRSLCASKNLDCTFYAEELAVPGHLPTLDRAMIYCVHGILRVAPPYSAVEIRAGQNHSLVEIHVSFTYPGLSEFITLRLFEPFGLRQSNQDAAMFFTLARRIFLSLGGDGLVKRRSGTHVTLAFTFPLHPVGYGE